MRAHFLVSSAYLYPRLLKKLCRFRPLPVAFSRLLLPPNRNPYPFHSLPTPFSLALLVSILISRGWRTMQPATFHPSVFHSFIPFRLLSFRKLFLSARRCSFHTISRRILSFLSYFANWAAQNPLYNILLVSSKP